MIVVNRKVALWMRFRTANSAFPVLAVQQKEVLLARYAIERFELPSAVLQKHFLAVAMMPSPILRP